MKDITGQKFSRLTVIKYAGRLDGGKRGSLWECKCDCGEVVTATRSKLVSGDKKSCGCLYRETRRIARTHGLSGKPLYNRWRDMMSRCYYSKGKLQEHYGQRGITVCKRWHNAALFYEDNIKLFKPELELDRIDNNKGYSPENCRWATRREQVCNTRRNRYITYKGKKQTVSEWATELGINYTTVISRLNRGLPVKQILSKSSLALVLVQASVPVTLYNISSLVAPTCTL